MTIDYRQTKTIHRRFWEKVVSGDNGCWNYGRAKDRLGYGHFTSGRRNASGNYFPLLAHRFAYEDIKGPIPAGMTLDHLCRNPSCVNPAHLEPVTQQENMHRGFSPTAINKRKTHCKNGHSLNDGEGHYLYYGKRICKVCVRKKKNGGLLCQKSAERSRLIYVPLLYVCSLALLPCTFTNGPEGMVFKERPLIHYSTREQCHTQLRELQQNVNSEAFMRRLTQTMPLPYRVFGVCDEWVIDQYVEHLDMPA